MNSRVIPSLAIVLMASTVAVANPKDSDQRQVMSAKKVNTITLKQADAEVESVTPELANIVVLCATEEDEKFEKEWRSYVDKHELKGAKLEETIAWVSEEAANRRHKDYPGKGDKEKKDWAKKRAAFMSEVANRALVPAR